MISALPGQQFQAYRGTTGESGARRETDMGAVKSVLHWVAATIRRFREFASGDDLHEAQMHRGDGHEIRPNPGGP